MTDHIFEKILEVQKNRLPSALVTVIRATDSTPRNAGSKMIVFSDGSLYGTVGGSSVEALVLNKAIECIKTGKCAIVSHNLNDLAKEDTGMICGGQMDFFIEPLSTMGHLFIFGGGHVALSLSKLVLEIGFEYTVIDDRAEFANRERFPKANEIIADDMGRYAMNLELQPSDFIAIMTRGHVNDYEVLLGVIKKPYRYLGMIGSKKKRGDIFNRLKDDGVPGELLKNVHSPIGLEIKAETPEEIAVSIVAELIKVKNDGVVKSRSTD